MCELCDNDRVTVLIADTPPDDDADNTGQIARDLSDCAERIHNLAAQLGPNYKMLYYAAGTIASMAEMLETM